MASGIDTEHRRDRDRTRRSYARWYGKGPLRRGSTSPASDMVQGKNNQGLAASAPWWQEWEVILLLVLVLGVYFTRIGAVSLRGEETRRARIAIEMIESGDWVVPRQQGEPFLSRPPLQNWAIAGVGLMRGKVDAVAIRLPSLLALLLTVFLVYGYARTCLSRLGAMAAAAAFATMGQVLELARLGETDMLLTFFLSGSLLVWHYGQTRCWSAVRVWVSSYSLVALAVLTKGPQGAVYFCLTVGTYLVLTGRWREAVSRAHLAGIAVFLALWGAWQWPFYQAMGWEGTRAIYCGDVALRFEDSRWMAILKHLAVYPAEVLLGCLLPWSVLLVAYAHRSFRQALGPARQQVLFLACAIAVTFPTCWLAPGAKGRYYMPLYPCFAPLIGLVVQRCCDVGAGEPWRKLWPRFLIIVAVVMAGAGVAVAVATAIGRELPLVQPGWFAAVYLALTSGMAAAAWWSSGGITSARAMVGVLSLAAFLGLSSAGVVANGLIRVSQPTAASVAELKQKLPPGVRLVSLGPIDHLFAYYYGEPIPMIARPGPGEELPEDVDFFSSGNDVARPAEVNSPWERIAVISCERRQKAQPRRVVVVGRRLPTAASAAGALAISDRRPGNIDPLSAGSSGH